MKTTTHTQHKTQLNMSEFEKKMLVAEASGLVDLIEVPAVKSAKKIILKKVIDYGRGSRVVVVGNQIPTTMNRRGLQEMYLPYKKMLLEEDENFFDYNINLGIASAYLGWGDGAGDFQDVPYDTLVVGKYAKLAKFLQDVATDELGYVKAWIKSCNGGGVGTENVGWHYPWYKDVADMKMSAHRLNGKAHALKLKTMEKHGRWLSKETAVKLVLDCPTMPMSKLATVAAAKTFQLKTTKILRKLVDITTSDSGTCPESVEFDGGWGFHYHDEAEEGKGWMSKTIHSFQVARDSLVLREMAKRKSTKGEMLILEDFSPVGGRAQAITIMKKKGNYIWLPTTLHKFHGEKGWFLIDTEDCRYWDGEWEIPFIQKIPLDISSEDEKTILSNKDLVIFQSEMIGGQEVVDVDKTLKNIAKFNKAEAVELEGVNLKVLREFTRSEYKFLLGWTEDIDKASPRVLAVEELSTGEIYQVSKWEADSTKNSLESAIKAFHKRAAAKVMQQEVDEVVVPDKGVLVFLQDSYTVGNCVSGTAAWMERVGLSGETVVPLWKVHEAAEKSDNNLARNVVKVVVAEYLQKNKVA